MEVIATTKFTRCVPYFQMGNTFMNLKYDIKSVRSGLHIANSPTLHKNKKKLEKKERKKQKKRASQTNWLKSHCHLVSNGYLSNGFKVVIVFIGYNRLTLLYRFIYSGLWCTCPTVVTSCSSLLWLEAAAAKDKSTGVNSVRGQHIKLIPTCKKRYSKRMPFQSIQLLSSAVMNTIAHYSKWNGLMLIKKLP